MALHTIVVEKNGKKWTAAYTDELKNDLKEVHGIDVEVELRKLIEEQISIVLKK